MECNVINAEKNDHGFIIHTTSDGKTKENELVYTAVRAGLKWPTKESMGYYCILGEEYNEADKFTKANPSSKLRLLAEREIPISFFDTLFKQLTDDCRMYCCDKVFTELGEEHEDQAGFYREYLYENKIGFGQLNEAPYVSNFILGISIIRRWLDDGRLDIPDDSIAIQQLRSLTDVDLQSSPEKKYHTVNGLRYAIAAFHKFRPSYGPPWKPKRAKGRAQGSLKNKFSRI